MADYMKNSRKSLVVSCKWGGAALPRLALAGISLLLPFFTGAAELLDPTRPPASIVAPESVKSDLNQSVGLQSILIGKTRRAAIIDGQTVELGGRIGEARLVEVNEGSVVLKTAQGRQVLTLFDVKRVPKDVQAVKVRSGKHKPTPGREGQ
jgi:MSHA biogenesis protein MshK